MANLKELPSLLRAVDSNRRQSVRDAAEIVELAPALQITPSEGYLKLRAAYKGIVEAAEIQRNLLRASARLVSTLIAQKEAEATTSKGLKKRHSAVAVLNSLDSSLPQWPDIEPPPLCGAIPVNECYIIAPGQQVAACVSRPRDQDARWILATVFKFDKDKYTVDDIMEESAASVLPAQTKNRHILSRKNVIPLPMWAPIPGLPNTFFLASSTVLALYPQTTCFYPAKVFEPPTQERPSYLVHFDDDDYEDGRVRHQVVPVRYVVAYRGKKR
eukprot:m.144816 g.144816  ORF g.144816 m.144816 type:complete len:272 (-) comp17206_c0_seq1:138-953(-)